MNFDEAIHAHAGWKLKLGLYLNKPDRSLTAEQVGRDERCDLGKWIHGEGGERYGNADEFARLKEQHRRFHHAAADIIRKADAGWNVSEEIALGAKSEYAVASNAIVTALPEMKMQVEPTG